MPPPSHISRSVSASRFRPRRAGRRRGPAPAPMLAWSPVPDGCDAVAAALRHRRRRTGGTPPRPDERGVLRTRHHASGPGSSTNQLVAPAIMAVGLTADAAAAANDVLQGPDCSTVVNDGAHIISTDASSTALVADAVAVDCVTATLQKQEKASAVATEEAAETFSLATSATAPVTSLHLRELPVPSSDRT